MSFGKNPYDQGSFVSALRQATIVVAQVLVLILLSAFPLNVWHFADVRPAFLLMAVYNWEVFRPQMLSPTAAFFSGAFLDLLSGGPLGLNALTLTAVQWFTKTQRRFLIGQSFPVLWLCFFLMSFAAFLFQWAVFSAFSLALSPLKPALAGALLTGLFFPPVAAVLNAVGKKMSGRSAGG